jgi:hypothetical protein
MLPTAYIETSVVSYLTSRGSRDPIAAAHQQLTRDWWLRRRTRFDLYVSELVVQGGKSWQHGSRAGYEPPVVCTPEELMEG